MIKYEIEQRNRQAAEERGREALEKVQAERDRKELDEEIRKINLAQGIQVQK